jgi:hypothetical protein
MNPCPKVSLFILEMIENLYKWRTQTLTQLFMRMHITIDIYNDEKTCLEAHDIHAALRVEILEQ